MNKAQWCLEVFHSEYILAKEATCTFCQVKVTSGGTTIKVFASHFKQHHLLIMLNVVKLTKAKRLKVTLVEHMACSLCFLSLLIKLKFAADYSCKKEHWNQPKAVSASQVRPAKKSESAKGIAISALFVAFIAADYLPIQGKVKWRDIMIINSHKNTNHINIIEM